MVCAGVSENGRRREGCIVTVAVSRVAVQSKERGNGAGGACEDQIGEDAVFL